MENRGQKYHRERIEEALREEIVALVEGELGDPRIGLVSLSECIWARAARPRAPSSSPPAAMRKPRQSIEGLNAARGYIRHELTRRLGLRQAPEIFFELDRSEQYGGRIEELLHRIQKRKKGS